MPIDPSQLRIIFLPGMQGAMWGDRMFVKGLQDGGATDSRVFDWTGSWWPLTNLRDREQHQKAAERLAGKLAELCGESPDKQTVLIGHSTGAMVILDVLGCVAEPIVDQAWLISAAVGRHYDLRPALTGAKQLCNLYSESDYLVLHLGTKWFGTADGAFAEAAGHLPFTGPGSDDPKLEQIPYDRAWIKSGHVGLHLSPLLARFARQVMLPLVLDRAQ